MNRLSREPSAYLRQHSTNPVDWYPWSDEALATARRLDRPIVLSIGYSACHWCHVMERECFEDPAIARQMNEDFVSIKVDRDERPDLDQLYQGVAHLFGRGGGWPLTVFLTPELKPFYGGTYFPPANRNGMPGFPRVLDELARAWREERAEVDAQAKALEQDLAKLTSYGLDDAPGELGAGDVVAAARALERETDPVNGGFGSAPKFPMASALAVLLRGARRARESSLAASALTSLERMAEGGIFDQLGGGFHRYSVDGQWQVPHFEKMLYDNAQLLELLAEAEQFEPRPLWREVAGRTVDYLQREMASPGGAFFASQDADSEGAEGKFFVWTPAELAAALPPEDAALAREWLGVSDPGNFDDGATVLHVAREARRLAEARGLSLAEVEEALDRVRARLYQIREARVRPGRDEKLLAGWNGLAIRGLSAASRAFGRPGWAALATRAADHIVAAMWRDGRLARTAEGGTAFLEDYGHLAAGLCALYQATFEGRHLATALELADAAVRLFWEEDKAAYLTAPRGQADLLMPTYAQHDESVPSGASTLTEAQVALAALTDQPRYLEHAGRYLARMRARALKSPLAFAHLWLAADAFVDGAAEVTLVGSAAERRPFLEVLSRSYAPTVAVRLGEAAGRATPERRTVEGKATAYLCRHFACLPPFTRAEDLKSALAG